MISEERTILEPKVKEVSSLGLCVLNILFPGRFTILVRENYVIKGKKTWWTLGSEIPTVWLGNTVVQLCGREELRRRDKVGARSER